MFSFLTAQAMTWINTSSGNLTHAHGAKGDIGTAEPLGSELYEWRGSLTVDSYLNREVPRTVAGSTGERNTLSLSKKFVRPPRQRSRLALTLAEREEISRGLACGLSLRVIAARLGRSPSMISRELQRNGGTVSYRAVTADQAAWDRAQRPKHCKLAGRRFSLCCRSEFVRK